MYISNDLMSIMIFVNLKINHLISWARLNKRNIIISIYLSKIIFFNILRKKIL